LTDDIEQIERTAGALLQQLTPAKRRALLRRISRDIANSQRSRIARQLAPDGSGFTPRKEKVPPAPGRYAVSFLYPSGGSGEARKVILKSYTIANRMMTGWDIEAEGVRSFFFDKVIRWLPVEPQYRNASAGKLRRGGSLRRKAMFRRLTSSRFLRAGNDDLQFWVGFSGRAAEIARIHQEGLRDRPSRKAKPIAYPARELLGFSAADRTALLDAFLAHFEAVA
jgi:phage virion morphogenesis (putative tail completion) protein